MLIPPDCHIAVFTKPPVPGQVKTRLIPALGADGAARLHHRLLLHTLEVVHNAGAANLSLWVAGDPYHPTLQACRTHFGVPLHAQQGHDLGERMAGAFGVLLRNHARVLLIGTDCPPLTAVHLGEAAARLDHKHETVLIPAEDGGYVLVGVAARPETRKALLMTALFQGIDWGTGAVLAQTRARLAVRGVDWAELPPLWDLDRPEDLARLETPGLVSAAVIELR